MCAIVDVNVVHEVFGVNRPEAGIRFRDWISSGSGRLVIGGQLKEELTRNQKFKEWTVQGRLSGQLHEIDENTVKEATTILEDSGACISDDPHIIALAQVSGARLLFTNDRDLQEDFGNRQLVNNPRGKIYTTRMGPRVTQSHRNLLRRKDLCTG